MAFEATPQDLGPGPPPDARAEIKPRAEPARGPIAVPDWALGVAGACTLFAVWEAVVKLSLVSSTTFPEPTLVLQRCWELITDFDFLGQVGDTMKTWLAAVVIATAVAVPTGLLMGYFAALYRPASTVVHAARSVPATSLIPVAILLFGLGFDLKLAVALYAIVWPLLLNAMYGVRSADGLMITTGRSLGWGKRKILVRVILPAATPLIATGVRLASSIALVLVLSTELLGASTGVGTLITQYQQDQENDYVYAGILIVGLLGAVVYYALSAIERYVFPWAVANRRSGQ